MRRPLVGVAGEALAVRKHFGDQRVVAAPSAVVEAVREAGGVPVVLPPGGVDAIDLLDALVLLGGPDVGVDAVRDADELGLLDAARSAGLPTLGICRGLQLMAVSTGGTLVEDLGDGHVLLPLGSTHAVHTVPGSVVAGLVPDGRVGSLHHQSVATYDDRWRCTATAADGVVEALEWTDLDAWPAVGVQWHPELDRTGPAVLGWLVSYSRLTYRQTGTGTVVPLSVTAS